MYVLLIKDIFRGGRGGGRDIVDDETEDEGGDSCGAFVLKIFSGVAAGCGEDDLTGGSMDDGGDNSDLKISCDDESFPSS